MQKGQEIKFVNKHIFLINSRNEFNAFQPIKLAHIKTDDPGVQ